MFYLAGVETFIFLAVTLWTMGGRGGEGEDKKPGKFQPLCLPPQVGSQLIQCYVPLDVVSTVRREQIWQKKYKKCFIICSVNQPKMKRNTCVCMASIEEGQRRPLPSLLSLSFFLYSGSGAGGRCHIDLSACLPVIIIIIISNCPCHFIDTNTKCYMTRTSATTVPLTGWLHLKILRIIH